METSRRGFFKWLSGATVAAVPAALGSYTMGVNTAIKDEDKTMFNFTCGCGEGICGGVPKNIGAFFQHDCICGTHWKMEWMGDHFKTEMTNARSDQKAFDDDAKRMLEGQERARKAVDEVDAPILAQRESEEV